MESLDDDLNMAPALAALFRFIKKIHIIIDKDGLSSDDQDKIDKALKEINSILGVMDFEIKELDESVEELIAKRDKARKAKNWDQADRIRQELRDKGVEIIDTKEGTIWRME